MKSFRKDYEEVGEERSAQALDEAIRENPELEGVTRDAESVIKALTLSAQGRLSSAQRTLSNVATDFGKRWPRAIQLYGHLVGPVMDPGHEDFMKSLDELVTMRKSQEAVRSAQEKLDTAERISMAEEQYGDVTAGDMYSQGTFSLSQKVDPAVYKKGVDTPAARLALLHGVANLNPQEPGYIVYNTQTGDAEFENMDQRQHDAYVRMSMPDAMAALSTENEAHPNLIRIAHPVLVRCVFEDGMRRFQELAPKMMADQPIAGAMPSNLPNSKTINVLAHPASQEGLRSTMRSVVESGVDLTSAANMAELSNSLRPHLDAAYGKTSERFENLLTADNSPAAQIARMRQGGAAIKQEVEAEPAANPETPIGHPMFTTATFGVDSVADKKRMMVKGNFAGEMRARLGAEAAHAASNHLQAALESSHKAMGLDMSKAVRGSKGEYKIEGKVRAFPYYIASRTDVPVEAKAFSVEAGHDGKSVARPFKTSTEFGYVTRNISGEPLTLTHPKTGTEFTLAPNEWMVTKAVTLHGKDHDTLFVGSPLGAASEVNKTTTHYNSQVAIPGTPHTGTMFTTDAYLADGTSALHKIVNLIAMDK